MDEEIPPAGEVACEEEVAGWASRSRERSGESGERRSNVWGGGRRGGGGAEVGAGIIVIENRGGGAIEG